MPTPFRTAPIVQKSGPRRHKSLIHGYGLMAAARLQSPLLKPG